MLPTVWVSLLVSVPPTSIWAFLLLSVPVGIVVPSRVVGVLVPALIAAGPVVGVVVSVSRDTLV